MLTQGNFFKGHNELNTGGVHQAKQKHVLQHQLTQHAGKHTFTLQQEEEQHTEKKNTQKRKNWCKDNLVLRETFMQIPKHWVKSATMSGDRMNGWEGRTPPPEKAGLGAFFHLPRRSKKILQSRSCAQKFSLEGPSKMPPRPQRRTVFFPRLSPKVWDFKCLSWWFSPIWDL